ncbi:MAG TPA: amino acid adenylation domain-containing protein [Anaerolineae bacterium]|nr:amino acid adenylation domain-containing protein [Anaerolineae bacterium]HQI85862.1 amino acid adenylation domain-containing protein [Anaerolineae bacterium]
MTDIREAVQGTTARNTLSPAQRALLEKRLRGVTARVTAIPRRTGAGPAPLSFAQQRMWFHEQLEPGQPTYNIPIAVTLSGPLDSAALEGSLNAVVQRHASLRTTFVAVEGEPVQIVAPTLWIPLAVTDVASLSSADVEAQLVAEARAPFDLAQGPLLRARLLRRAETECILQLTFHHIIFDGWSLGIFFRELGAFYAARVTGQTPTLPALPIQYEDFAVWQREWLPGETLQRQLAYWKKRLSGALPVLQLATDRPRPSIQSHNGALYHFVLPDTLYAEMRAFAQREGVSLFMLLLAAFEVLLYRYTGQTDMLIGAPIANRTRSETEGLIGFFVNTLALRGDLSGDPTFGELLQRARQSALEAYEHQDLPFERLVEALQPERDLSRNPLFQVMFVFHNAGDFALHLPGIQSTYRVVDSRTAIFDLTLTCEETDAGLRGYFEYNTDLFDAETMRRMARHLATLLQGSVTNPDERIATLPLLTEAERQQLLVTWNATAVNYPQDHCVQHGFAQQAAQTPEAVAVVYGAQRFTYRQINAHANQLARYLHRLGVGPETLIGLYVERTPEAVIGILGVLKAGAAYLPLDPTYPPARTAFMLDDAKVAILLTQAHLVATLTAPPAHTICLDGDWPLIAQESAENITYPVTPDNLAYVIYTSGSTGQPKGVMVTHRGLNNYLQWCTRAYDVGGGQGAPVHSALSFDLTITSLFPPLLVGRSLTLLPETPGGEALGEALRRARDFSLVKLTPAHLDILSQLVPEDAMAGRTRAFIIGGEALRGESLTVWQTHAPETRLINEYGPTETVVGCCVYEAPRDRRITGAVPIGRPIANTQLYILDPQGQPAPIGVPGELYIGGDGVARGYLNRPALTAERFVPDPFGKTPGGRLYRTGDLARYLPDGNIEYLGRMDQQVKVRGYRVELGEIEAELLKQPFVQAAAVVVVKDTAGHYQLVAYIVPEKGIPVSGDALREELQQTLPGYMVPTHYVMRDTLPLTPNGKIDHRALAALGNGQIATSATYVAPRTMRERQIAAIWADVLGVEQVGIYDNFFELGGHSLQAVQVVSKITTALHCPLSVKTLFLHPTVAMLTNALQPAPPALVATQSPTTLPAAPFLTIEQRSLLSLFAIGKIQAVDSATLGYLDHTEAARDALLRKQVDHLPLLTNIIETELGRIGIILLPRFDSELYHDQDDLVNTIIEALTLARHLGARTVSLAGLIPSATEYGRAVAASAAYSPQLPAISTGHATTSAAVALTVERILQESGRTMAQECLGVLGLGSIGLASLRLLLKVLPHPDAILLCDLYSKRAALDDIRREILTDFGFTGNVYVLEARQQLPPEFYTATLILGATNTADVLDIARVQPGTRIVDDSSPHCFASAQAIQRWQQHGDILFTEGGVVKSPHPIHEIMYLPEFLADVFAGYARRNPFDITGCILSGLLSARFDELTPTVGIVAVEDSVKHYHALKALGFQAADFHSEQYTLEAELVHDFRRRFGGKRRSN